MRIRWGWVCVLAVTMLTTDVVAAPQSNQVPPDNRTAKVTAAATPAAQAEASATSSASKLPVRRVVLYKSGVGYFEHQGNVRGDQTVGIDFTSGQLNDVLQSLTLLDLNCGRITGVNYNSQAPLSQRLGNLSLPLDEKTDIAQFYGALRGVRLEIKGGGSVITGRLLSVERKTRVSGGTTLEVDLATLVSDSGRSAHRRDHAGSERPGSRTRRDAGSEPVSFAACLGSAAAVAANDGDDGRHR